MSTGARGGGSGGRSLGPAGKPRGGAPDGQGDGDMQPITWARQLQIGPAEGAVLTQLVLLFGQTRKDPYPAAQTLADWTKFSLRKVREALANLERLGLITARRRRGDGGRQGSNSYALHVGKMVTREEFAALAEAKQSKAPGNAATSQSASGAPWASHSSVHRLPTQHAAGVSPECTSRSSSVHAVHPSEVKSQEERVESDDGVASARHQPSGSASLRPSAFAVSAPARPLIQWESSEEQRALTRARKDIERGGKSYVDWLREQADLMGSISRLGPLVLLKGAGYLPRLEQRPSDSDVCWQSYKTWPCSMNGDLMVPDDLHTGSFLMAMAEAELLATAAFTSGADAEKALAEAGQKPRRAA
jgi:hypothetical protein